MRKELLKTVNVDLPEWMVADLDREAEHLGINRKALINVLLAGLLKVRRESHLSGFDIGYLKAIESTFANEWGSRDDDEAFKDL